MTQNESLTNIPTSTTKSPFYAMSSNLRKSVIAVPRRPKVINGGADSDVEIIETDITIIDLDETSNDVLNFQSAVEKNPDTIIPEVVSVSTNLNDGIDEPPATVLPYDQFTSSASSALLNTNTKPTQSLPVSSTEQSILPSTTEEATEPSQNMTTANCESPLPQVLVIEESPDATPNLFYSDRRGAVPDTVYHIPLYDPISDDSFCSHESVTPVRNRSNMPTIDLDDISFDSQVMPSPKLRKRKRKADDSVIFVSETLNSGASSSPAASFIPVPHLVNFFL